MTEEEGDADDEDVGEAWKRRPNNEILGELQKAWQRRKHKIWDGPEERYWLRVRDPEDEVDNFGTIKINSGTATGVRAISPLVAYKQIEKNINPLKEYTTRNRDGSFNIVVPRAEVTLVTHISQIGPIPVIIEKHPFRNKCRGTVHTWDSVRMTETEILNSLKASRVTKVVKKKYTNKDTKNREFSGELLLTFDSDTLPAVIKLGWLNLEPQQYLPKPLQCNKCFRFGNQCFEFEPTFTPKCTGKEKCGWCGEETGEEKHPTETGEKCGKTKKCIQCKGNHQSWSKYCPAYIFECDILATKETQRISYKQAKKVVDTQISGSRPASTAANIVYASKNNKIDNKLEELLNLSNQKWEERFETLSTVVGNLMAKMESINSSIQMIETSMHRFMTTGIQPMAVIPPPEYNSGFTTPSRQYQESMMRVNTQKSKQPASRDYGSSINPDHEHKPMEIAIEDETMGTSKKLKLDHNAKPHHPDPGDPGQANASEHVTKQD